MSMASRRSRSSAASGASRASRASQRSGYSVGSSRRSAGSAGAPAWAQQNAADKTRPWNFEALPMYGRTNESYGNNPSGLQPHQIRTAGKSESGFLEPETLIAALTRPEY